MSEDIKILDRKRSEPAVGRARPRPEKATAATIVYEKLRQDILKNVLAPGQKLPIEFVADLYGAGTNPVREALNRLSSERLVDRHDQRGFFVPEISIERWRELVKTRCWLEVTAMCESMRNRTPEWEENIVLAFHRLSRSAPTGEAWDVAKRTEWETRHRAFHLALLANCGSSWLLRFCELLMDQAQRYILISAISAKRSALEEHRELMDVVVDGEPDRAAVLLVDHYNRTLTYIENEISR